MREKLSILSLLLVVFLSGCGVQIVPKGSQQIESIDQPIVHTDPDEKVTLNIVDWSDSTKKARQKLNEQFMEDHPNVTINYTTLTQAQFNETVVSGIRSGNAPDLFPLPSTATFSTAIDEGWFLPLDNYLTEDFFSQFSDEIWQSNVTTRDGKRYLLPEAIEIPNTLVFYNKDLLKESSIEIDPATPLTWDEFIDICSEITAKGQGSYYGLVASGAQKNRLDLEIRSLSELAGINIGPTDQIFLKNGEAVYDSEGVISVFDFYYELYEKGLFHPDSGFLTAPEARNVFGEGHAAFIIQGSWSIPTWNEQNPSLNYGVMKLPIPDPNKQTKISRPFNKGWLGISATSEHPDVAAEYLKYLYSYEYQKELVSQGGFVSIRKDITEADIKDPIMKAYYQYAMEQSEETFNPLIDHPENQKVYSLIQPVTPDLGDIGMSIFADREDYPTQLKYYNNKVQENLERAVEMVNKSDPIDLQAFESE